MFGRVLLPYIFICLTSLLLSCASKNDVQADDYLNRARELTKAQKYQLAKLYVDSVRIKYPKDYNKIREGLSVIREINFEEQKRTLTFCDSMLKIRQDELPEAQNSFIFEKNAEYETIGHYVYKAQTQDKTIGRTFLQTKVDENGNLILISYYSGFRALSHTSLRVSSNDGTYAESLVVPRDGALNYEFNDNGTHYEIVCFNKKAENGVVNFILSHENGTVTVTLTGGRTKTYKITTEEKDAMKAAFGLSTILTDINRLLNEIRLSQAKMEYIQKRQESLKVDSNSN
jgi:hypothetical protein